MGALTTDVRDRQLFLVIGLAWLFWNASVLLGGRVLPWDALDQFYPTVFFNAQALRSGAMPWWNPYIYSGVAQVGDPQGMLFSPLLMAWMIVPPHPGASWFAWGVLVHVLLGAMAMVAVLQRHGTRPLGTLLGAMVYMGGGVAASRLEHVPIVLAYAYVPVVLLTLRRVLEQPRIARGAVLGIASGAMVAHLTQATYLFVLMIAAYACVALARWWPASDGAQRWRLTGAAIVAGLLALALGAPQLVFSWASLSLSNRLLLPLSAAAAGSLDPRAFWSLAYPNAYGALRDVHATPIDPVGSFLYIGVVPALVLFALGRAWRAGPHRRTIVAAAMLAVLATVYALGTHAPVYAWLYNWMPGLSHFRRPGDAAYLLNIALAFLVATGASYVDVGSRRGMAWLLGLAGAWLLIIAVASRLGSACIVLAALGFVAWQWRRPGSTQRAVALLALVVAADYRSFNFNGTFNATGDAAARFTAQPATRFVAEGLQAGDGGMPSRMATTGVTTLWDNMGEVAGIASTQGYNPLRYALYEQWYRPRESAAVEASPSPYNAWPGSRLDDLLSVRYLVVGPGGHEREIPPDYIHVGTFKNVAVWRNDGAYPRILNPREARLLGPGVAPGLASFNDTDFATTVWLTPRDDDDFSLSKASVDGCAAAVVTDHLVSAAGSVALHTHASAAGWLVFGEIDHPGWVASLDGGALPIHRANGLFRAVCVPAGHHALRLSFSPWRMIEYAWQHRASLLATGN